MLSLVPGFLSPLSGAVSAGLGLVGAAGMGKTVDSTVAFDAVVPAGTGTRDVAGDRSGSALGLSTAPYAVLGRGAPVLELPRPVGN